ncbi:hypothetical protein [Tepidibacter hydrothermalis]|uniref:Hemolysin XhlA n=1 Tax=Tepidibacter hydrothermalis TaxID=3036126 RepID=A0ABY8EA29_9FIRM|nr:hypothetical protein [Tepidibacter hydrothermalis]WFD09761.1 hypothetical protein P4S50_15390 [Tepidibacter hydrothermalis]
MELEKRIEKLEKKIEEFDMKIMTLRCIQSENAMYLHSRVVVLVIGIVVGVTIGRIL